MKYSGASNWGVLPFLCLEAERQYGGSSSRAGTLVQGNEVQTKGTLKIRAYSRQPLVGGREKCMMHGV